MHKENHIKIKTISKQQISKTRSQEIDKKSIIPLYFRLPKLNLDEKKIKKYRLFWNRIKLTHYGHQPLKLQINLFVIPIQIDRKIIFQGTQLTHQQR